MERFGNQTTSDILSIDDERVLIASWRNGIVDYNTTTNKTVHYYPGSPDGNIPNTAIGLFKDSKGRIWVTSDKELIHEYHPDDYRFTTYKVQDTHKEFRPGINLFLGQMSEHPDGTLWMGSNVQGLIQFDPNTKKIVNRFSPDRSKDNWIKGGAITFTYCDDEGSVWAGSVFYGLYKLYKENGEYKFNRYLTQYSNIGKIMMDSQERMWVGTFNDGLFHFDPKAEKIVHHYTTSDGLPSMNISDIWEGKDGWFWILSAHGVIKYHPDKKLSVLYDKDYGIEIGQRLISGAHLKDDNLYIGGDTGFYKLDLKKADLFSGVAPTNVIFNNLYVNDEVTIVSDTLINFVNSIELSQDQDNFSIDFSAIHLDDPQGINYNYKLEPYHDNWQDIGKVREARMNNVPPGHYKFIVKAANEFGAVQKDIQIIIKPFWYNSLMAKIFYLLIGLTILVVIFKFNSDFRKEKVQKEKEKELSSMRSRFFANISHEFKTPLTLLQGPIQDKIYKATNKSDKEFFSKLDEQTDRMSRLVNELVDLSKIQQNKLVLKEKPGNISHFLKLLGESFESLSVQKDIQYEIDIEELNTPVRFDRDQLEKLVVNLLSNAFNHTPASGRINYKGRLLEKEVIQICIENTGEPIPSDELAHIFKQFYQAENAVRQGSGIGLALVNEIVKIMQGTIDVTSDYDKGTRFEVRLPFQLTDYGSEHPEQSEMIAPQQGNAPSDEDSNDADGMSVLIVEDNIEIAEYIKSILRKSFRTYNAFNGEEGLKMAEDIIPDIIISDVMMPKMDGIELCKRLKQNKNIDHIPVVILTAKSDIDSRIEGLNTGADYYVSKPFNAQELSLIVENILKNRVRLIEHYKNSLNLETLPKSVSSMEKRFLEQAISAVMKNLDNSEYSTEQFATDMFMSRAHLYRKLKATTGQGPSQFVRNIRLEQAALLLKSDYDNVSIIAYEVGFNNLSYFTKCFKEKYGVSPKNFR